MLTNLSYSDLASISITLDKSSVKSAFSTLGVFGETSDDRRGGCSRCKGLWKVLQGKAILKCLQRQQRKLRRTKEGGHTCRKRENSLHFDKCTVRSLVRLRPPQVVRASTQRKKTLLRHFANYTACNSTSKLSALLCYAVRCTREYLKR